jgi:predicted RNA-binding protein
MKERRPYLLEIYKAFKTDDIKSRLKHFDIITNSLFTLTQSLFDNKVQIEHHHAEIENKYFRFGMANHSIKKMLDGNRFLIINKQIEITDLFSVFALTRMQIESFAIMYYLFFDKLETIEKYFRYDLYKLHGLQKQNKFPLKFKKNEEKKKIIEKEIDILMDKIKGYINNIDLDNNIIKNQIVSFSKGHSNLIGNKFFEHYLVTLDWKDERFYLTTKKEFESNVLSAYEFDFFINYSSGKVEFFNQWLGNTSNNSINFNSEILKVNDINVKNMSVNELCELWKNETDKIYKDNVELEVKENGIKRTVILEKKQLLPK